MAAISTDDPQLSTLGALALALAAAGERSTTVSLYAVHGDRLDLVQRAETGRGANWVRFV